MATVPQALHPASPSGERSRWLVLATVALGMFVLSLDTTVNVALPAMTEALDAPIGRLQWIIIAYVLTNTSLVLGFGRIADIFGRARVWTAGQVVLAVFLLLCGTADAVPRLAVFRFGQALGAAMIASCGAALVTAAFPAHQRGRALGALGMGASLGAATGPVLGGALVSWFGWQGVFFGRVPLALTAAVVSFFVLPRPRTVGVRRPFDGLGALLLAMTMATMVLGLNRAPAWGWNDRRIIGLLAAAVLLLAAFILRERSTASPVIDLRLFRRYRFTVANAAGFLSSLAMFGIWLLLPYYLVDGRGYVATRSGLFLACVPVTIALTAPCAGWLTDRRGARLPTAIGLSLEVAALLLIARFDAGTPPPVVVLSLVMLGVGLGLFQSPNQSTVMGSVPQSALAVAGSMLSAMMGLGIVSSVAVLGAVYEARRSAADGAAFSFSAFSAAFMVAAAVAAVALTLTLSVRRRHDET